MDHYLAAHRLQKINLSLEDMPGLEVVVDVEEAAITMTITELPVVVGLLIQVGAVGLSLLRHHLHRCLLLARHQVIFKSLLAIQQVLLHWHQIPHLDLFLE
jgi:hypothetical protein